MSVEAERAVKVPSRKPKSEISPREKWARRSLLAPALIYCIVLTQIPFLVTVWYSMQSWNLLRPGSQEFVFLANYVEVIVQPAFRTALLNTVVLTVGAVVGSVLFGLALALLLDRKFLGKGLARTLLVAPFLVMPTAAALIWKTTMFHPVYGTVNFFLSPFGVGNLDWASRFPMASIIIVTVWQWTPFMMLILLAGLQGQDRSMLEAARVDGAGSFMIFRRLTFPHLRPYIELGVLLGSIFIVQTFDAIFMITQGGPGRATTNVPYYLYLEAFRRFEIGQAAALGVVVVIATIVIATLALRVVSNLFRAEGMMAK